MNRPRLSCNQMKECFFFHGAQQNKQKIGKSDRGTGGSFKKKVAICQRCTRTPPKPFHEYKWRKRDSKWKLWLRDIVAKER